MLNEYSKHDPVSGIPRDWDHFKPLRSVFGQNRKVQLEATVKHCTYLHAAAADRGIAIEVGDMVKLDFMSSLDDQNTILAETDLVHDPAHETAAVGFLSDLYADVPRFFSLLHDAMATGAYFMRRHGPTIQAVIAQRERR